MHAYHCHQYLKLFIITWFHFIIKIAAKLLIYNQSEFSLKKSSSFFEQIFSKHLLIFEEKLNESNTNSNTYESSTADWSPELKCDL